MAPVLGFNPNTCASLSCRRAADFVKAYFVQVAIISNHQNGRDTHVRQIKVFGPRQDLVKAMGHEIGFTSAEFAPYAVVR